MDIIIFVLFRISRTSYHTDGIHRARERKKKTETAQESYRGTARETKTGLDNERQRKTETKATDRGNRQRQTYT